MRNEKKQHKLSTFFVQSIDISPKTKITAAAIHIAFFMGVTSFTASIVGKTGGHIKGAKAAVISLFFGWYSRFLRG